VIGCLGPFLAMACYFNTKVIKLEAMEEFWKKIFKERRFALAILIGLSLVVYLNSLNGAFVSDDIRSILKNPWIGDLGRNLSGGNLSQLTYSLNFHLTRFHPFIYHLTNLLIHFGVVILAYFFLLQITNQEIALIASAFYAVHPLNTEAVSWISGRPYCFGALFLFGSLLLYIFAFKKNNHFYYYYFGSLTLFIIALFTNNKLIASLLIFGLYELVFGKIIKRWRWLIPYFILTLLFVVYLIQPFQTRVAVENPEYAGGIIWFNPIHQIPIAVTSYLQLFVWPMDLTLYHEDMSFSLVNYLIRVGIFVILLGSLIYFYRKEKLLFFGFSFFLFSLVPTMLPIKIAWVVAERYVYFGLIGLCLVVAWALVKGLKKYPQILLVVTMILVFLLSARTIIRNQDWRTRETLWVATAKVSPTSSKAWNNMGDIYAGKKDFQNAIRAFQRAIELRPNYVDAHHNIGVTYSQMEDYENAILWFQKAIAINPIPQSYNDMGVAYFYLGDLAKAEESLKKAIELGPNIFQSYNSLGLLYMEMGRYEEARQALEVAIQLNPYNEGLRRNLLLLEQRRQASPSASPQE
jgi:tetratricopeptide (TPR) repeat protein